MITPSKKAILYLRVSTEEQVENFSLGTQEEICRREAQFKGYKVVKIFREEGRSAKTIKGRHVLIQLLDFCQKNKSEVQAVFVYKTDRLSRQIFDYLVIQQKLSSLGIKLVSATEPTDDSAMGKFLGNFFAQIAQFDNDVRSERAKNGMRARFNSGLYHTGLPPKGYLSIEGTIVKDPKTFDKIRSAWELMATGTKTLKEIQKIMDGWGISLVRSSVHRMFRSKFYVGVIYSPTYKEEVQGQHIPMITRELFNKVQVALDGRSPYKLVLARRNPLNPDFPLRRFIKCGVCGAGFTGCMSKGKFPYYYCHKYSLCRTPYIQTKKIHMLLKNLLDQVTLTPTGKAILLLILEEAFLNRSSVLKQKDVKRTQQLKRLYELQKTLVQKHLTGIYSDEIFGDQNQMIEKNIKSFQTMTNNKLTQKYNRQSVLEYINKVISNFGDTYEAVDVDQQKILTSLIFPRGFTWNFPGLAYNEINPLFREESAKIPDV